MSYQRYTFIIVIFVFLVVLAGGIVRTTQSGMGCPDWPKCFGMWIPPVSESQLPPDFEKYLSKQDIDHTFNVYHTWIEYVNRLLGAILGLLILIHFIWSVLIRKRISKLVLLLSFLMLVMVSFTGWLGKVVVDNNLAVFKITLHMLSALVLAILPMFILRNLKFFSLNKGNYPSWFLIAFSIILLIQLYLGTVVREEMDIVSKGMNFVDRDSWISKLGNEFIVHRSFSWIVLFSALFLYWRSRYKMLEAVMLGMVLSLLIMGIMFVYVGFPAILQPLHLLISMLLISISISFSITVKQSKEPVDN